MELHFAGSCLLRGNDRIRERVVYIILQHSNSNYSCFWVSHFKTTSPTPPPILSTSIISQTPFLPPSPLQKSQPPRNPINHPPRPRPHPQHRPRPPLHLRPAGIAHDLRAQAHTDRFGVKGVQFVFGGDLEGDFGLAGGFPAVEEGGG